MKKEFNDALMHNAFTERLRYLGIRFTRKLGVITVLDSIEDEYIIQMPKNVKFKGSVVHLPNLIRMPREVEIYCTSLNLDSLKYMHAKCHIYCKEDIMLPSIEQIDINTDIWTESNLYMKKGVKIPKDAIFIIGKDVYEPSDFNKAHSMSIRANELIMV